VEGANADRVAVQVDNDQIKKARMLRLSTSKRQEAGARSCRSAALWLAKRSDTRVESASDLQLNKRGNRSKMATAGLTNYSPAVSSRNLAFSVAVDAHLAGFHIDDDSSLGAMILQLILHRRLAFFLSGGLADRAGKLACFEVFVSDGEFPFYRDDILRHINKLYDMIQVNTRYCIQIFLVIPAPPKQLNQGEESEVRSHHELR
jgi:hypothetical protein